MLSDATPDPIRPGQQFAQNDPDAAARVQLASDTPPLQRIHPDSTYESDSSARQSLNYWRQRSTGEIVESLKPGTAESLTVYPDGRIANGNTRVKVLQERDYAVETLPRDIHAPGARGGGSRGGPRGGGAAGGIPGFGGGGKFPPTFKLPLFY